MIPVVDRAEDVSIAAAPSGEGTTMLIRIGADGQTHLRGQALDTATLQSLMQDRLADSPLLSVVLLPSSRATTQDLVTTMDTLTSAGVTRLRLMQLDAEP
jgi:biopolymer transport protein ExbD